MGVKGPAKPHFVHVHKKRAGLQQQHILSSRERLTFSSWPLIPVAKYVAEKAFISTCNMIKTQTLDVLGSLSLVRPVKYSLFLPG